EISPARACSTEELNSKPVTSDIPTSEMIEPGMLWHKTEPPASTMIRVNYFWRFEPASTSLFSAGGLHWVLRDSSADRCSIRRRHGCRDVVQQKLLPGTCGQKRHLPNQVLKLVPGLPEPFASD